MQIKFSTVSRVLYLLVTLGLMYFLGQLAYGWSLSETEQFMLLVFGRGYAKPASWLVQIGQQPLLLLHGLTKNTTVRNVCMVAFLGMVSIDAVTNIGAYQTWLQSVDFSDLTPQIANLARYTGYVMCVVVVFSEEALILLSGVAFHLAGMLYRDFFGQSAPKWFMVDAVQIAAAASGARSAGIELPTEENGEEHPSTDSRRNPRPFMRYRRAENGR